MPARMAGLLSVYSLVIMGMFFAGSNGQSGGLVPAELRLNLARGRQITATATCGEGTAQPEMFCKLIGASLERGDQQHVQRVGREKYFIVQGQICDYCDPSDPDRAHPASHALDGSENWWQSPPLSRGSQFMEVNLTVDFNQEFYIAYVVLKMGNAPRPEVWVLERSSDYGKTFQPWQYFADPPSDCPLLFGVEPDQPINGDDDVLCTSKFSRIVPLEGGEILVSLVNDRPGSSNFLASPVLQNWLRATNIRFSFRRMKTLMGHSSGVARQDQTVTRRYYYSVRDISIGGMCVCNGHASACEPFDPHDPARWLCRCAHNTCGTYCDHCCPGFVQKKWQPAFANASNECEPCNCHGHSSECQYDPEIDEKHLSLDIHGNYEGGGVCRNCHDNTEGINCEKCRSGFFRPYGKDKSDRDACQVCRCNPRFTTGNCAEGTGICECKPNYTGTNCDRCNLGYYDPPECKPCDCNYNGTMNQVCNVGRGACPCKPNYTGPKCDQCADTYYDFPNCTSCDCDARGSPNPVCDKTTGQCACENSFGGLRCDQCGDGYYGHPRCSLCDCDPAGTVKEICQKDTGVCICKPGYDGVRCDRAAPGFYGYPEVKKCDCHAAGSINDICDSSTGRCPCKNNFSGRECDLCATGYYKFPECLDCKCDPYGTIGTTCDNRGQCQCKKNFVGKTCNQCNEGFYNYPLCEGCNCNPAGLITSFGGCGKVQGELCQCKERVTGRICDQCKPGYWGLDIYNPLACDECTCHAAGTISALGVCNPRNGRCPCKTNVESRTCDKCRDGFYSLDAHHLHGCVACGCDVGGATTGICEKNTGQCQCRPRINGKTCSQVLKMHYFPTLHHLKFEAEDGHAKENAPVQYEFNVNDYPGYSWRGYAVMSTKQPEIYVPIQIRKPSLYRLLIQYVNLANASAKAEVIVSPEMSGEIDQKSTVEFLPTKEGKYVGVGEGTSVNTFVLHPGHWEVVLKTAQPVLIDYIVLLPQAYYEATILQQNTHAPCLYEGNQSSCQNYTYPDFDNFVQIDPLDPTHPVYYKKNGDNRKPQVDESRPGMRGVLIDESQPQLTLEPEILPKERHHLILSYFTADTNAADRLNVSIQMRNDVAPGEYRVEIYDCPYAQGCRSVVVDERGHMATFAPTDGYGKIVLVPVSRRDGAHPDFVLTGITAVPRDQWSVDYVRPKSACVVVGDKCEVMEYMPIPESEMVEAETDLQANLMRPEIPALPAKVQTALLYQSNQSLYLRGSSARSGNHVFLVHYYQPHGAGAQLEAAVQGVEATPAVLETSFCPSISGCRAVLRPAEGQQNSFRLGKDYSVTIKGSDGHEVYIDYVVALPADKYREQLLQEPSRDLSARFIGECADRYFDIDPKTQGFCRQATFSLVSGFNSEAVSCDCNLDGSVSMQCEEMGGQCQCRANVIGRKCTRCKSGFWGFPACKQCNCPFNSICDPVSGACICPPKVQGDRCDTCMPRTFGFHAITGCQDCNCNPYGSNGSLSCDQDNGNCYCKKNVAGRKCDHCLTGYYSFPQCQACHYCDIRGATDAVCDQTSGQCLCKENVAGPRCDVCKASTFLLDTKNPQGCTKCFCFGITHQCHSSSYLRYLITSIGQANWTTVPSLPIAVTSTGVEATPTANITGEIYWVAPEEFLGNRVTSYGGNLTYSVIVSADDSTGSMSPDVVLKGKNMTLVHFHDTQPSVGVHHEVDVEIVEKNFEHESGNKPTRDQFMMLLAGLEEIRIKAGYFSKPKLLTLNYASIHGALSPSAAFAAGLVLNETAQQVEECRCPPGYAGPSCEECAPQHFRSKIGPYLGMCLPCDCNNHAERCDVETGQCINCLHNTTGERCERCAEGYHGDATRGSPYDCMICACPLPIEGNNFATTCEVAPDGLDIYCTCREGYVGERCQHCAPGYFGRPDAPGGYCQPCQCHDNIDPLDPESCDRVTGECRKCLKNTTGDQCQTCATDFYGDPTKGLCQVCDCEPYGTEECNTTDGSCKCWPNVVGPRCDKCAPNHWNFESGKGCSSCYCGVGSKMQQCNLETGQCLCQPGAAGQRCDQCAHGYWNLTAAGCQRCACATKYSVGEMCDQQTGHCSCLPGVTGSDCDRCKARHVLKENYGCISCEDQYCVVTLLDDFDTLHNQVGVASSDFERVSATHFAIRRQNHINETIGNLTQAVNFLQLSGTPSLLNAVRADLEKYEKVIDRQSKTGGDHNKNAQERLNGADKAREDLVDIWRQLVQAKINASEFRTQMIALEDYLRLGPGRVTESAHIAEPILNQLKNRKFDDYLTNTTKEKEAAEALRDNVKTFQTKFNETDKKTQTVLANVTQYQSKMRDLEKLSINATETAATTQDKLDRIKENITDNINALTQLEILIRDTITNSSTKKTGAQMFLTEAETAFAGLDGLSTRVKTQADDLEQQNRQMRLDHQEARRTLSDTRGHVYMLENEANRVDNLFNPTRNAAADGKKAANVYDDIVDDVEEGKAALANATIFATEITGITSTLEVAVPESKSASETLNRQADQAKIDALKLRGQVESNQNKGAAIREDHVKTEQVIAAVRLGMGQLPKGDSRGQANTIKASAVAGIDKANEAMRRADEIIANLAGTAVGQQNKPSGSAQDVVIVQSAAVQIPQDINRITQQIGSVETMVNQNDAKVNALGNKLAELKEKIELTRSLASRIKVGSQFTRENILQVKNPRDLSSRAATYTHASLFFKTVERDGLLFYLGNEMGTSRRVKRDFTFVTDDYMALQIMEGFVELVYDLGSGAATIRVDDRYVADNQWYQAIVERIGKTATVLVRYPRQQNGKPEGYARKSGTSPGANSVFNLNQANSTFFVGGVPLNYRLQIPVRNKRFAGYIEQVAFDEDPVGLWNMGNMTFDTERPTTVPQLAGGRNQLIESKGQVEGGIKLDGTGYAVYAMEARTDVASQTSCIVAMKTFAKDGLLFYLAGDGNEDFLALELRDGFVVFKYNLGSGVVELKSQQQYNDGNYHNIQAQRFGKRGGLMIDGASVADGMSPGHEDKLEVTRFMYLGGTSFTRQDETTATGFEGCVNSLEFMAKQVKLDELKESKGSILGCPETIRRGVSFEGGAPGYLAMPSVSVKDHFHITLKFRTAQPDGLLFFTSNEDVSQILSLSLREGRIVFASDDGKGQTTSVETELTGYWNGEWHYVSAMKETNRLKLMIDDFESVQSNVGRVDNLATSKPLFFGGIPAGIVKESDAMPKTRSFDGCIGDVVINDVVQNFAISQDKPGASFASCMVDFKPGVTPPTLPPQPTQATLGPFHNQLETSSTTTTTMSTSTALTSASTTPVGMPVVITDAPVHPHPVTVVTVTAPAVTAPEPETTPAYAGPVLERCVLPEIPDVGSVTSAALQFGSRPESRQEFSSTPSKFMEDSEFSVELMTRGSDGVILYVDDQKANPIDFLALYMKDGYLVYSFNPGAGSAIARSRKRYNDGKWHSVKAVKQNKAARLLVDDEEVASSESPGTTVFLNTKFPLYFGGMNGKRNASKNLESVLLPFNGCLRNLRMNGVPLSAPSATVAVTPCSERTEPGAFFPASGGYIALRDKFVVNKDLDIAIEIKPRSNNGVILAVGTVKKRRDYLAIQLIDGTVDFSFDNGAGPTHVNVTLPSRFFICDGEWHTIKASKSKFMAMLSVDDNYTSDNRGPTGVTAADTDTPIYLGSLPASVGNMGKVIRKQYVGCMRNLVLSPGGMATAAPGVSENFATGQVGGNVLANFCHTA
ncbi:laminin subunit alpha-like [Paramacrobiotus metropolitanus]|uniref:laminin subunit alpha-like n=1 Tax=Paramacrobiotus metropolitanus TaxID=2943436 RepID=UPI0024463B85|nr:laminin subunit alpha-like [Paramacrobiotus metropolitanus]